MTDDELRRAGLIVAAIYQQQQAEVSGYKARAYRDMGPSWFSEACFHQNQQRFYSQSLQTIMERLAQ